MLAIVTPLKPVMVSLAIRRVEGLKWGVESCLGWYHDEYQTGLVQGVPVYRRRG